MTRPDTDFVENIVTTGSPRLRSREHGLRVRSVDNTAPVLEKKDGISLPTLNPFGEEQQAAGNRMYTRTFRNNAAFWLLGVINNSGYVIMMAVAKEIAPDAVGVVFLADVAPTLLVKLSAPYWFHLVSYNVRVLVSAGLMVIAMVTVGYGGSTAVQLMGVCCLAVQSGLGESSFLALASFYDTPRALTAWSSGTGFAGIFGYAWVFFLTVALGLSFRATLMIANLLPMAWLFVYFVLLPDPRVPHGGHSVGGRRSIDTRSNGQTRNGVYSPLSSGRSTPSFLMSDVEGRRTVDSEEEWGAGGCPPQVLNDDGSHLDVEMVDPSRAAEMTVGERLRFTLGLWRFTVPLMLVYFAEYTMQTGTWSAIGFPLSSPSARQRFYEYANWCYQGGVFVSRSSGMIVRLSPLSLWILPLVQMIIMLFFYFIAVEQFWYDYSLLFLCFGVGLVGGLGYVNAFRLVAEAVPPELEELALASASVGDSIGVMFSDIFGTFVQACVYKQTGIPGAWATC